MIRAFIFDIYNTLLEAGGPPPDAEARWLRLCHDLPNAGVTLSLAEFEAGCQEAIAAAHAMAKSRGVLFPEPFWPDTARRAFPALRYLSDERLDDFLFAHAQLQRTVRLMNGAAPALAQLRSREAMLGLCSNCQPYTLRELDRELSSASLSRSIFDPQLCFFSFRNGFSKPDPKAFELLEGELAARRIPLAEALLAGDSLDKDIAPARQRGWQTWHLAAAPQAMPGGNWFQFLEWLGRQRA